VAAEAVPLRLVDSDGVIVGEQEAGGCAACRQMEDQIDGLERDVRAWRARYADLARDVEKEAKRHPLYEKAEKLFGEWQHLTGHTRSKWSPDRFKVAQPFLKKDGYDLCLLAIQGAAFDPFTKPRANGTMKRFDDWELVFRDRYKFEEFCNRAPKEALAAYKASLAKKEETDAQAG
jgi:hypothetical protein